MINLKTDLSVKCLRGLCKQKKVSNYSKLNKEQILYTLNSYYAALVIQRCYRSYFYKNTTDHITMDPVCYPCFIFKTKFGKLYFYNYDSIIKYIMKTGNTKDPMTRIQYSDEDLLRLDLEAKKHFPNSNFKSCYKIKKNVNYSMRIRNRENEILSYQMRLDEIKTNILVITDSDAFLWDFEEPILIDHIEYPNINSYLHSMIHEFKMIITALRRYDPDSAEYCKRGLIESIQNQMITQEIELF